MADGAIPIGPDGIAIGGGPSIGFYYAPAPVYVVSGYDNPYDYRGSDYWYSNPSFGLSIDAGRGGRYRGDWHHERYRRSEWRDHDRYRSYRADDRYRSGYGHSENWRRR